jgi:hypothetical protein
MAWLVMPCGEKLKLGLLLPPKPPSDVARKVVTLCWLGIDMGKSAKAAADWLNTLFAYTSAFPKCCL